MTNALVARPAHAGEVAALLNAREADCKTAEGEGVAKKDARPPTHKVCDFCTELYSLCQQNDVTLRFAQK